MALVNAPDKVHSFQRWAKEVIAAATINFGSRAKSMARKSRTATFKTRKRRKRRRKNSRTRRSKNG